ncbi:hypothetical protein HNQ61_002291 [Longimicrobium terrae]|uniref:Uncharacterized protein n=1 Tax=Longimicrobium terrae TaxID=1639882 RepID=A0A841GY35_9BACT|nr:hypothetical protein [Longimicrobium terrae]
MVTCGGGLPPPPSPLAPQAGEGEPFGAEAGPVRVPGYRSAVRTSLADTNQAAADCILNRRQAPRS